MIHTMYGFLVFNWGCGLQEIAELCAWGVEGGGSVELYAWVEVCMGRDLA